MVNEFELNLETFKRFRKMSRSTGVWLVFKVLWCVVLGISVLGLAFLGMLHIKYGFESYLARYIVFLCVVYSAFKVFFFNNLNIKSQFKSFCKLYGKTSWIERIEVFEEKITITEEGNVSNFNHTKIKRILEGTDIVTVMYEGNMNVLILKDKFVTGSWEECKHLMVSQNPHIEIVVK